MQALNFAQLLIYLQIILLFERKDGRTYWLLIMLSLLQVVVAALFSQGVFFGILLVVYMLLASLALTLLMLSRQSEPGEARVREGEAPAEPQRSGTIVASHSARQEPRPPATTKPGLQQTPSVAKPVRWPLIGQQSAFDGAPAASSRQGVGGELFRRLSGMSVRTLGLTMALFIIVPRFGQIGWQGGITPPKATVGFNDEVALGEMGKIIESPSEVMRVRFYQGNTDIPYSTSDEIYLYGAVLMDYRNGKWNAGITGNSTSASKEISWGRLPGKKMPKSYVVQKCELEGLDRSELFFVPPAVPLNTDNDNFINFDEETGRLIRYKDLRRQKFSYSLGTTAFKNGVQSPLTPTKENEVVELAKRYPRKDGEPVLKRLRSLADAWIAESKLPPEEVLGRARYLEHKLAASGLFKYSLEAQDRDPAMDPIEDFLTKHRAGHCEYFATALTLLLRHVDIPARMVVGYKCDEWNELGQCYQVRQLHAHAWVEAHLDYRQLTKESLHGEDYWKWEKYGGWLRLDPTPGGEDRSKTNILSPITKGMQWLDFAWSYYVVELNYERQRKAIFTPIAEAVTKAFEMLRNPKTWKGFYERIGEALHRSGAAGVVAWLLLILASLAGLVLCGLLGFLTWRWSRKLWRLFASKRAKRRHGPRIEVEFYRRLEHLLAKNGLARPLGQTPREFASVAGEWLAVQTGKSRLLPLPEKVVEAYYHVRFGRLPLDICQSLEIEQILKDMELQMANRKLQMAK